MIRSCSPRDAAAIARIYNHYVLHTVITFEEEPVSTGDMEGRIGDVTRTHPWLVCEQRGAVVGFAYARPWNVRSAYRHSVEVTIYLEPTVTGRGLGRPLYEALLDAVDRRSIHRAVAGIALPNEASVRLHERLGFVKSGHLPEIGRKFERWIDVGYWVRALPDAPHSHSST